METGGDPVRLYADRYRKQFADLTAAFIDQAVQDSGIDLTRNAAMAEEIRRWMEKREQVEGRKSSWTFLVTVLLLVFFIWGGWLLWQYFQEQPEPWEHIALFILYSVLAGLLLFAVCLPKITSLGRAIGVLNARISEKTDEAIRLLRPFYGCFDWNTVTKLIEQVVPFLRFDDYLSPARLTELVEQFGLPEDYLEDKSVLFTHSGSFWGYPFLFLEAKKFYWGSKTYTGYKTIHWSERERGADGKYHRVSKSEVLSASITRPYPMFTEEKCFFFGHDAAPHLSFSREPSSLSGAGDSFFTGLSRKFKLRELRQFSQNLTDDSDYTLMSNHDFEVLFHAVNRDHEVEFRLLFTALAQQQMVNLLNDTEVGFGDDFYYQKSDCLTSLASEHLNGMAFSTDPAPLQEFDFSSVRNLLQQRYEDFFHRLYFTFAPLMTIPLYNQPRPEAESGKAPGEISSWEMESIANYHGCRHYQARNCITDNLLKVYDVKQMGDGAVAEVTAHGFSGTDRVEYESVWGGDGRSHRVRVDWVEYREVQRQSRLRAHPAGDRKTAGEDGIYRRSLVSYLPDR